MFCICMMNYIFIVDASYHLRAKVLYLHNSKKLLIDSDFH